MRQRDISLKPSNHSLQGMNIRICKLCACYCSASSSSRSRIELNSPPEWIELGSLSVNLMSFLKGPSMSNHVNVFEAQSMEEISTYIKLESDDELQISKQEEFSSIFEW